MVIILPGNCQLLLPVSSFGAADKIRSR